MFLYVRTCLWCKGNIFFFYAVKNISHGKIMLGAFPIFIQIFHRVSTVRRICHMFPSDIDLHNPLISLILTLSEVSVGIYGRTP